MSVLDPTAEWLERANRLATTATLLSTTVHEVNNALQVINGGAEMLGKEHAPESVARRAESIGVQARRASALLADLSAFARDESTALQRMDLGHLGQKALAMRQYTFARLGLQVALETSGGSRLVSGNARRLLQIVLNLIVNAERAMIGRSSGKVMVTVHGAPDRVELTVADNGPGIPAAVAARLFEAAAHAAEPNLGIGLVVSKSLAEMLGGSLRYEPAPTGGSAFTLTLPAAAG